MKKKTYKAKKDIPINTNDVIKDDISTDLSKIKLSKINKSIGSTDDFKQPDMTINLDLKNDTKFELFSNKNDKTIQTKINNNSNIFIIILVPCLLIGIFNLH